MAYYLCDSPDESGERENKTSQMVKYPDSHPDNILVRKLEDQAISILKKQPGLDLKHIIEQTDECTA